MNKHYIFFRSGFPQVPVADSAHYIHDVQCANASLNLGQPTLLVYGNPCSFVSGMMRVFNPSSLQRSSAFLISNFGARENLMTLPLPIFWPMANPGRYKALNSAVILSKYYFPLHVAPKARLLHTQEFLIAEAAVRCNVPVVYEQHYEQKTPFKSTVINSRYFKFAICQHEKIRESLIRCGIPDNKTLVLDNGFEEEVLMRYPESAADWRRKLLCGKETYLAVYSGALFDFKGVGLLMDAAKLLPHIKFVLTGGSNERVSKYREDAKLKNVENFHLLGWVEPRNRIFSLLQAADILLEPHLACKHSEYTNPVKFFQYLGSGSPIAATKIPPYFKFFDKKLCILWSEPNSVSSYAEAIQTALRKFPRRESGYSGNIDFSRQFTWEKRMEKIFSLAR